MDRRRWIAAAEFEDGIAATNLLPGPASTQLAIFTAWRLRGLAGALVGGACFIVPGLVLILALALQHAWQYRVLVAAAVWLLAARRGVVSALLGAGALGAIVVLAGWPVS